MPISCRKTYDFRTGDLKSRSREQKQQKTRNKQAETKDLNRIMIPNSIIILGFLVFWFSGFSASCFYVTCAEIICFPAEIGTIVSPKTRIERYKVSNQEQDNNEI